MQRTIVVTGGTKGIGRAILEKFAAQGFDVVTCARNEAELNDFKASIEGRHAGVKAHVFKADMARREEVSQFVSWANRIAPAIEVLVNNAGYFIPGEICTEPEGTLESMINANLYSAYYTTRGLAPSMRARRSGHIFNICSIASIKAYANGGSYAISKFAMLGLSKCLREELKNEGIRVTSVLPGATLTRSWEGADFPDDRFMTVEDVAEMVWAAFSLSPRSVVEEILIRPQLGDI